MSADAIAKGVAEAKDIDPLGDNVILDEGLIAGNFSPYICRSLTRTNMACPTRSLPTGQPGPTRRASWG